MYYHIVFTTKYSRYTIHDNPPVLLNHEERKIVQEIIHEKESLGYTTITYSIMDDHVHLLLYSSKDNVNLFMRHIKGKSSYQINHHRKNQKGIANQTFTTIRSVWYSDTTIQDYTHLTHTIQYIQDNHTKHKKEAITYIQSKVV